MSQPHNAQRTGRTSVAAPPAQYLIFNLAGEPLAIEICHIREIIEYRHLTTVPMMPAFIRGVINLRGAVVPVVDLAARFGREKTAAGRRTCIVIVDVPGTDEPQSLGVMVDAVSEVLEIQREAVEPAPNFGARIRSDFIDGMGRINDHFVIILDVVNVFSLEEMAAITSLSAPEEALTAA